MSKVKQKLEQLSIADLSALLDYNLYIQNKLYHIPQGIEAHSKSIEQGKLIEEVFNEKYTLIFNVNEKQQIFSLGNKTYLIEVPVDSFGYSLFEDSLFYYGFNPSSKEQVQFKINIEVIKDMLEKDAFDLVFWVIQSPSDIEDIFVEVEKYHNFIDTLLSKEIDLSKQNRKFILIK